MVDVQTLSDSRTLSIPERREWQIRHSRMRITKIRSKNLMSASNRPSKWHIKKIHQRARK